MVIVHVLSSFGVGGQERVALDLAIGQAKRGHTVAVVSLAPPPDGPLAAEFAAAGIPSVTVAKRGGLDPTLVPRLALALRRLGAQIVHTHNPLPLIYAAPAGRLVGARVIHSKHGMNPTTSRGQTALRRGAARLVSWFVAVSEVTGEQAREQRDVADRKLVVIPNGIRLERFAPNPALRAAVRAELGIPDDAWVVGTVGRLDDYKNQAMLVRVMAPVLGDKVRVVIVGDGPTRAQVEAAVAALPEPRFAHVLGRRMDVDRIVPSFDVFALTSLTEGLPLVVPEAMSAGLPVVTTAVGGLPGVIDHGVTGFLSPVEDAPFAAHLETLRADPMRAHRMGAAAREAALARFSAERMVDDYLALYARARA
ncbi:MAG: glycosyltransferase [Deltaproteobacteria bacterium]|nr:glycosyltransferase [Deltaproteobacteria bacterium]